jgi:glycosyltransferase involved in cell wall biosynthesis
MRVVSVQTSNERGGGEYANVDLLDALAGRGHDVKLVTNLPDLAEGTRVPVREVDLGPKLGRAGLKQVVTRSPLYAARFVAALRAEARLGRIDAVLLHYKKEQLMSPLVTRRLAERVVWAEWGPLPFEFRTGPARRVYAGAAARVHHVACVSEGTRETIVAAGIPGAKVSVVPNLVEVADHDFDPEARVRYRAEWGVDDDTFVVGCIARFQHKKRNDVLVDALAHLPADAKVLVVLAGSGPDEDALRARAAPHGDRVRFLPTPRGYVEQVLSACDVQVFAPSPTEGASRAVILGLLTGRPVIATDPEGAVDLIPPGTGTIVSPSHDPAALAGVLEAYRADPERCAREGAAARAYALERFDPARTLDAWTAALGG